MFPQQRNRASLTDERINKKVFEELWSERKEQNKWIFAMFGFVILVALSLISFAAARLILILTPSWPTSFYGEYFANLYQTTPRIVTIFNNDMSAFLNFAYQQIFWSQIMLSFFFASWIAWNIYSFAISYRKSVEYGSYHLLNGWFSSVLFAILIIRIFVIGYFIGNTSQGIMHTQRNTILYPELIEIVLMSSFLVLMFILNRMFKKVFSSYFRIFISEITRIRLEEMKASGSTDQNEMMKNIFSMMNQAQPQSESSRNDKSETKDSTFNPEKDDKKAKEVLARERNIDLLLNLSRDRLDKMAEKLRIFDYQSFSKEKLAEKIVDLTEAKNEEKAPK